MKFKRRRRRSGSSAGLGAARGFVYMPKGLVKEAAIGTIGFMALGPVMNKLPLPSQLKSGPGRIVAKLLTGLIVAGLAKRFAGDKIAKPLAVGATLAVGIDVFNLATKKKGVAGFEEGVGEYDIEGLGEEDDGVVAGFLEGDDDGVDGFEESAGFDGLGEEEYAVAGLGEDDE